MRTDYDFVGMLLILTIGRRDAEDRSQSHEFGSARAAGRCERRVSGPPAVTAGDPDGEPAGLAQFRQWMRAGAPAAPICETLDFDLSAVGYGMTAFTARLDRRFNNPAGVIHGGFVTVVMSSSMSCAVHTTLRDGERYTTTDIVTHLVRPLMSSDGPVVATGRLIQRSRRGATAEGRVVDAAGRLVAHGTTTCVIFPAPSDKQESKK